MSHLNDLHRLPCMVSHNGTVNSIQFFLVTNSSENQADDLLESSFRGRRIQGRKQVLPPNLSGIILNDKNETDDTFKAITYWHADDYKDGNNWQRQGIELIQAHTALLL